MDRISRSEIEFATTEYELAYGHRPRGRGSWAFEFHNGCGWSEPEFARREDGSSGSMLYSEAKRIALARAVELGAILIRVCT